MVRESPDIFFAGLLGRVHDLPGTIKKGEGKSFAFFSQFDALPISSEPRR